MKSKTFFISALAVATIVCIAAFVLTLGGPEREVSFLSSGWEFYSSQRYQYGNRYSGGEKVKVPSYWTKTHPADGYGFYRNIITGLSPEKEYAVFMRECPGTASVFYVNGKTVNRSGIFSVTAQNGKPQDIPVFFIVKPSESGCADLAVEVSNYTYRVAGLWTPVYFGERDKVFTFSCLCTGIADMLAGVLFILCIIHVSFFVMQKERQNEIFIAVFIFSILVRTMSSKLGVFTLYVPQFPYDLMMKLEYSPMWIGPAVFMKFLMIAVPEKNNRYAKLYELFFLILGVVSFILPIRIVNRMVPVFIAAGFAALIVTVYLLVSLRQKMGAVSAQSLLVYASLIAGMFIDYFVPEGLFVTPFTVSEIFLFGFSAVDLAFFTFYSTLLYRKQTVLSGHFSSSNKACLRFIPGRLVSMMGKQSAAQIQPGDFVEAEAAYACIRYVQSYTDSAEKNAQALYKTACTLDGLITASVEGHNGFVCKFQNSSIIAVFPDSVNDAIRCARDLVALTDMRNGIQTENIRIGIGIHYGKAVIGTTGGAGCMETTVISDAINTASGIATLALRLGSSTVVSQDAAGHAVRPLGCTISLLGVLPLAGKEHSMPLFICR